MGVKEQLLSVGAYIYKNESIDYLGFKRNTWSNLRVKEENDKNRYFNDER